MGQRLLEISVTMLVDICRGLSLGPHQYFEVVADPIPEDATIVSVRQSPYRPDTVEVTLESPSWEPAEPRTPVNPQLAAHHRPV